MALETPAPDRSLVVGSFTVLAQSVDKWWQVVRVKVPFLGAEGAVPQVIDIFHSWI